MQSDNYPEAVAIIGGGPAAAATALSLLRAGNYRVSVFEARRHSKVKIGESIPPVATPILERLGQANILSASDHRICSGNTSVWGGKTPGHNDFWLQPGGRGFHLDRIRFDNQMKTAAQNQGVHWREGWRLRSVDNLTSGFKLQFSLDDGSQRQLSFDFVVDASGQAASFARRLGVARNVVDEVICLCAVFSLPEKFNMTDHSLLEAVENGWWYAARLPGERVVICFTSDAETISAQGLKHPLKWRSELARSQFMRKHLPKAVLQQRPEIQTNLASSAILSNVVGEGWLAVGDAACSYDPLTSAGITKALAQGEQAGATIAQAWRQKEHKAMTQYQNTVFQQFSQYVSLRNQLYRTETRFHRQPFWRNRRLSMSC